MLRNIFPKIFLCFLLCNFLILSTPGIALALTPPPTTNTTTNTITVTPPAEDTTERATGCNPFYGFSILICLGSIVNWIFTQIFSFINSLLSYVLWLAALILDFTIYFTVVKFKTNFSDLGLGGAGRFVLGDNGTSLIYYLWGMVRDFLNIIIFISIIYAAVYSMFEGFENTRRKFITLLVFSIIANFSLLFVKVAIDISNILALQAYTLVVKPQGTTTFSQFRTSSVTGGVSSYGEYIMNSVDLEKLSSQQTGTKAAAEGAKNIKNTVIFQIGKMVTILGVIYILLFVASFLIARAGVLLYAMIISPLIALDIFFKMWNTGTGDEIQNLAKGVRNVTSKVLGDFYDALIKGPLIIFFIFLIGVFAEAILSKGIQDTLTQSLGQMKDFQKNGNVFTDNLFVFFKFAVFLTLCQILFNKINEFKFGTDGGKFISGWAKYGANRVFGRGMGGLARYGGLGLQNTLGRYASNKNSLLGRNLDRLGNSTVVKRWAGANSKSILGSLQRGVGGSVIGSINTLRSGSYDVGNLVGGIDRLTGNRLSASLKKGVGDIDFGKRVTDTFSERDEASRKARDAARDKEIEAEKGRSFVTSADIAQAKANTNIKELGDRSIAYLESKLSDEGFMSRINATNAAGEYIYAGKEADFLRGAQKGDADILLKIKEANEKSEAKAKSYATARDEENQTRIMNEYKTGKRKGESIATLAKDTLAFRNVGGQRESLKISTAALGKKQVREEVKKFEVINSTNRDLEAALKDTNKVLEVYEGITTPLTAQQAKDLQSLKGVRDKLTEDIRSINIPEGNLSESQKLATVKNFSDNKDLRKSAIKNKEDASDLLATILDKRNTFFKSNLETLKEEADTELRTLKLESSQPPAGSSPAEKAAYVRATKDAERRLNTYTKLLNDGFSDAQKIKERAEKTKERIEAQFEPKVEKPSTATPATS